MIRQGVFFDVALLAAPNGANYRPLLRSCAG